MNFQEHAENLQGRLPDILKASLTDPRKLKITPIMFLEHTAIKIETNNKKNLETCKHMESQQFSF